MHLTGRPSKLTKDVARTICQVLRRGGTKAEAAQAAGIGLGTLMDWQRFGRDGIEHYADLVRRMDAAKTAYRKQQLERLTAPRPFSPEAEAFLRRRGLSPEKLGARIITEFGETHRG